MNRWLKKTAKPEETPHKIYAGYCFAHVLHRIATVMLVYVNHFLGDLRSAITSLNHSVQLQKYLNHSIKTYNSMVSEDKKIKFNKLSHNVATHWNSKYKMISQSFILIERLDANTHQKIRIQNVSLLALKKLPNFLELFNTLTSAVTRDTVVTMSEVLPVFNSLFDYVEAMGKMIEDDRFYDIEKVIRQDLFNQKLPLKAVYNLEDLVDGTDDAITTKQNMSDARQPVPSTQQKRPKKNVQNTTQSKVPSKRNASLENNRKSTRSKKQRVAMSDFHVDTTDEDDDLDYKKPIEDLHVMNENVENNPSSEDEDSDRSKNNSDEEDVSDSEDVIAETILDDSSF
jgi:hypothetical protein